MYPLGNIGVSRMAEDAFQKDHDDIRRRLIEEMGERQKTPLYPEEGDEDIVTFTDLQLREVEVVLYRHKAEGGKVTVSYGVKVKALPSCVSGPDRVRLLYRLPALAAACTVLGEEREIEGLRWTDPDVFWPSTLTLFYHEDETALVREQIAPCQCGGACSAPKA